jgi:hypothetical protein
MPRYTLTTLLMINFIAIIYGAVSRIFHWDQTIYTTYVAWGAYFIFLIIALAGLWKDPRFKPNERTMWTFGLIFLGSFGGLIYLLKTKKL